MYVRENGTIVKLKWPDLVGKVPEIRVVGGAWALIPTDVGPETEMFGFGLGQPGVWPGINLKFEPEPV